MEFGICPVNLLEFKDLQQREPEISVYQNRHKSALKLLESKNVKEKTLNQILNSLIQNTSIHKEFHVYWPLQQNNERIANSESLTKRLAAVKNLLCLE